MGVCVGVCVGVRVCVGVGVGVVGGGGGLLTDGCRIEMSPGIVLERPCPERCRTTRGGTRMMRVQRLHRERFDVLCVICTRVGGNISALSVILVLRAKYISTSTALPIVVVCADLLQKSKRFVSVRARS
jgi:hypothetical protein